MTNTTVPYHLIRVEPRMRDELGDIETLAASIADPEIGLICPLTVEENDDGTYTLLAGGRRHTAISLLRHRHDGDVADIPFANVPVYIRYNLSKTSRGLIELEENIRRKEMTWQEQVLGIAQVHKGEAQRAALEGSKWTQQMTGALFGRSHTLVGYALRLASALESGDEEIVKAATTDDAISILTKRAQREAEKARAAFKQAALRMRQLQQSEAADTVSLTDPDTGDTLDAGPVAPTPLTLDDAALDKYARSTQIILLGDSHDYMLTECPPATFDGIYTDIPYGIDMANLVGSHVDETAAQHDRAKNISLFETFLRGAYRVLKPETYCVFWFDVEHTTTLVELATAVGFRAQRWPLHAFKPNAQNQNAAVNPTKDYESVFVCSKTNATLAEKCSTCQIPWAWEPGEEAKYAHAFAKPHSAHAHLLRKFFRPSAKLLDPYCGEGSLVLSGLRLGYDSLGIDNTEHHVIRARTHVEQLL